MPSLAEVPALPDDLAAMLVDWTPQDLDEDHWQTIEAAVAAGVAAFKPTSTANLRNVRSIVLAFAAWLHLRPHRTETGALREVEFLADSWL